MRQQLYDSIRKTLMRMPGKPVRHVDIWNHNVEFIEQEEPFPMPAVFVEFAPIEWRYLKPGDNMHATAQLALHVVTQWDNTTQALQAWQLCRDIQAHMHGLEGDNFAAVHLIESRTNHNHELIIDNVEVYQYKAVQAVSQSKPAKQLTRWQQANVVVGRTIPLRPGNRYTYCFPRDPVVKFRCRNFEDYRTAKEQVMQYLAQPNHLSQYTEPYDGAPAGYTEASWQSDGTHPAWVGVLLAHCANSPWVTVAPGMSIADMLDAVSVEPLGNVDTRCVGITLDDDGFPRYVHEDIAKLYEPTAATPIDSLPQHWQYHQVRRVRMREYDPGEGRLVAKSKDRIYKLSRGHTLDTRPTAPIVAIRPCHSRRRWFATDLPKINGNAEEIYVRLRNALMMACSKKRDEPMLLHYRGEYNDELH